MTFPALQVLLRKAAIMELGPQGVSYFVDSEVEEVV
jgi:hypothetical protein